MTECGWQGVKGTSPLRFDGGNRFKKELCDLFYILDMICLMHFLFHLPANFTKK